MNVNTDAVIAGARTLPELIQRAKAADPQLAEQLTTKASLASSSLWGSSGTLVVSYLAGRFALGWDQDTCALVAGALAWVANLVIRRWTDPRVTGLFTKTPAPA
jgi:hypothetical protein